MAAGYAGTLWSYSAMGRNWRMGIQQGERTTLVTRGPFQFVRHPIYLFQIFMLAGLALLLPTLLSLTGMVIHLFCVLIKIADEESFLLAVQGADYQNYQSGTGKLLPKFQRKKSEPGMDGGGPK
jgi:protein-S-isoprenylcysteine O-methyltransferase Ste14